MKPKLLFNVSAAIIMVTTLVLSSGTAYAESTCDPVFVTKAGNVITVGVTGVDDTANLQCAFDLAVASGPGVELRLEAGTFHTAQVVVNDFQGAFRGAGMDNTIILNLPNLYVTPENVVYNPPSAANPWPSIITFVNGEIEVSDLAIHIVGEDTTTGWTIFGIDPPIIALAIGIGFLGTEADVLVERILVEGEPMEGSQFGYDNVFNGIYFEGAIGENPLPITGSFQVYDSVFKRVGSGSPVLNLSDAVVIISGNTYEEVFTGGDGGDLINSTFEFSHNKVNAEYGMDLYSWNLEDTGSTFLIKNNQFQGKYGPVFEQTFGEGNSCLLLGNNVQKTTDIGIYLGPGISGCTVVGGNTKTKVVDDGTGNILVGVNNMGTGVGPTIRTFMKLKK